MKRVVHVQSSGTELTAFCDESMRCRAEGSGIYMMSAVLVEPQRIQWARDVMASLRLSGQRKLHWRDESHRRRVALARRAASVECEIMVATWCRMANTQQERARRKAQQTLVAGLADRGVTKAIFESRGPTRDRGDIAGLAGLRRSGFLPDSLHISHAAGPTERALWAADVVAGAFGTALDGSPQYWDQLLTGSKATVLGCGACGCSHHPGEAGRAALPLQGTRTQ